MEKNEKDELRKVMSMIGSRTSERKRRAATENSRLRLKLRPIESFECTCGKCPDNPKTYCNRGRAILRRLAAQNNLASQQPTQPTTTANDTEKEVT